MARRKVGVPFIKWLHAFKYFQKASAELAREMGLRGIPLAVFRIVVAKYVLPKVAEELASHPAEEVTPETIKEMLAKYLATIPTEEIVSAVREYGASEEIVREIREALEAWKAKVGAVAPA